MPSHSNKIERVKILRGNFHDPDIQLLQIAGMPMDMERMFLLVYGDDLGFPDYTVAFYGVIEGKDDRPDARTAMRLEIVDIGAVFHVWRRVVRWNDSKGFLNEIYDRESKLEKGNKLGWVLEMIHLATDFSDTNERINLMHKLADGYHLVYLAHELVRTMRCGKTLKQIREWINESVDRYAREQTANSQRPEVFKATHFAKHWQYRIKPNNLYKLIVGDAEWNLVKDAYDKRCKELRNSQ
jgi:hypothetical protein